MSTRNKSKTPKTARYVNPSRLLRQLLIGVVAAVILFEEWLWDPLKRIMDRFGRWPIISALATTLSGLPPRWALIAYLGPMVLLVPFKIGGLWMIARGHSIVGVLIFLAAKLIGTALFAWLFGLTRPALLQIAWFAAAYRFVQDTAEHARAWIRRQHLYVAIHRAKNAIRTRLARLSRSGRQ